MATLKGWPSWRGRKYQDAPQAYMLSLGLKSHAGLILGGGTSADPVTSAVASQKMISFYFQNSATSGEACGDYVRLKITGVGGSGTCGRFYSYTNVAAATLQGLHVTAETGAAGTVSGQMIGVRSQLIIANDATAAPTGVLAGGQSELYFNGDNSSTTDISGTRHSIHRFIVDGDTTARALAQYAFEFVNISAGTSDATKMINTANITPSHGLNVMINDEAYCILLDKK